MNEINVVITEPIDGDFKTRLVKQSYDITPCLRLLIDLYAVAEIVNKKPEYFCETAQNMAHIIAEIKRGLKR